MQKISKYITTANEDNEMINENNNIKNTASVEEYMWSESVINTLS